MAIEKVELTRECLPKHSRMGTAAIKLDIETEEEGKTREETIESIDKRKANPNQVSSHGLSKSTGRPTLGVATPQSVDELPN